MRKLFPSFGVKNIALFYWITLFINGWFILPNWVFYYRQYISQTQVGVVEGVAVLIGILMEVPSGVFSDLLGKKNTIIVGSLLQLISCIILINAHEFTQFLIGNGTMFIGFAFQSGATEAFAYDALKEKGHADKYPDVIGKASSIVIAATLISTFVGGYLYGISPRAPFYAWIVFLTISIFFLWQTTEPAIETAKFNVKNYLMHLKEGTATLFNLRLRNYLVPLFTFAIFIKLYQGLVRQSTADYFGYTGETFGYLFAVISIPAIYMSFHFDKVRKFFKDKSLILLNLTVFVVAFFTAAMTKNMWIGAGYYLVINSVENIAKPLTSSIINERIDSKHRATALSTLALFSQIPYIILVLFFALMTEKQNLPHLFVLYGLVVMAVTIYSLFFVKNERSSS
jgi:MFS family permease